MSTTISKLNPEDLLEFTILVPKEEYGTKNLKFKVAVILDKLSSNLISKEALAFVDDSKNYFLMGVMNTRVDLFALRKFEDFPEYEFIRFYDPFSSS